MMLNTQVLIFLSGFVSVFCWLLIYDMPTKMSKLFENGGAFNKKYLKYIGLAFLSFPLAYLAMPWLLAINLKCFPQLQTIFYYFYDVIGGYRFNQILTNFCLGGLLALPVLDIYQKTNLSWQSEPSKSQTLFLGVNGFFLALIVLAEAFILGVFPAIQTPWMSVDLSPNYDAKLKPSIYEIKREINGVIEPLLDKLDIGCAMLGDREFMKLTIENQDELQNYHSLMDSSEKIVYPLIFLIHKAIYVQKLGEPRYRIASILAPVKRSLQSLLDRSPSDFTQSNEYLGTINKLDDNIIDAYNKLYELAQIYGKENNFNNDNTPRSNDLDSKGHQKWCNKIRPNPYTYIYNKDKIKELSEKDFEYAKKLPYIRIITALIMLYDGNTDGAINLLNKSINRYGNDHPNIQSNSTENFKYINNDMNIHYLISHLLYTDARPNEYSIEYNERLLNRATLNLNILEKAKSNTEKEALTSRYNTVINIAKNNISYDLIRKQSQLTDTEFALALEYAKDAYKSNQEDSGYIDTLGYVRLVTVLRNGKLGTEQQKHEIEAARILLEKAYDIAEDEYKAIVETNEVDALEESEARQSLMIYEDHLNEALRYEAEINRIE